jgi:adenosylcobyric acid synthase
MYSGVGANTGKTVFTRAHCRLLADRGLRVSPFKPVSVTERQETHDELTLDFRLWILGAAARCRIGHGNGPVQVLRTGSDSGAVRICGTPAGTVALMAKDTALFGTDRLGEVVSAVRTAYTTLADRSDVIVMEGSGCCADLAELPDPANTYPATLAGPAVVLIAGARSGGAVAALRGTWNELPERMRGLVVGFALNDVSAGLALLEKGARRVADEAGVAYLGALPHSRIYDTIPAGHTSALRDGEQELDRMAELFRDHIDVRTVERAAGLRHDGAAVPDGARGDG